ncbi:MULTISPECIES: hemin uptake protein HemP [unclassified Luteibacter]|uniref:hemin uptake protein HemP n=1 Tax=unclassified Luteibacter TaxID=2620188 RepID=UPI0008D7429B|nr:MULTISPECIES: hemin uptake protein HemP [unclassified Luteibacter]MDR6936549.1 hemin uptake protein HemP [Luteibacter sp. 3190]SEO65483.1 Hemin uptake protein hemP [Luteibacter sp. UNC138MFCol5.1]SEV84484.1 Hemin uptake protein hemP [Luteibacter sp. 329MFSha]
MLLRTLPLTDNGGRDRVVPLRPAPVAARRIQSKNLLDGSRELVIEHEGSEYHLRLTRNDKLILTK